MKRGINPKKVIFAVLVAIAALVICFIVNSLLPSGLKRFSGLIFWVLFLLISVPGVFLVGRYVGNDKF